MSSLATNDPAELAGMLRDLYLGLEDDGLTKSPDYGLARGYEDQLGSGQAFPQEAIESAKTLLRKHGFK